MITEETVGGWTIVSHGPTLIVRSQSHAGCSFCRRLLDTARTAPLDEIDAQIDALFDRADRAAHARRVYWRRKRGRW